MKIDMETQDTYGGGYSVMPTDMKIFVRDALVSVEWAGRSDVVRACPTCGENKDDGHEEKCPLKRAIDIMSIGGTEK